MEQKHKLIIGFAAGSVIGAFLPWQVVILGVLGVGAYFWLRSDPKLFKRVFDRKDLEKVSGKVDDLSE